MTASKQLAPDFSPPQTSVNSKDPTAISTEARRDTLAWCCKKRTMAGVSALLCLLGAALTDASAAQSLNEGLACLAQITLTCSLWFESEMSPRGSCFLISCPRCQHCCIWLWTLWELGLAGGCGLQMGGALGVTDQPDFQYHSLFSDW